MKLFGQKESITPNILQQRLTAMEKIANFKTETEKHRKARYALYKNMSMYESALSVFRKIFKQSPKEFKDYSNEKYQLALDCGAQEIQNSNGTSSATNVKDTQKFYLEHQKLKMKYKRAIKENAEIIVENEQMMNEPVDDVPETYMTNYSCFPDSIPANDLRKISFMIEDDFEAQRNQNKTAVNE